MTINNSWSTPKYWLYLFLLPLLFCSACEEYFNPNIEGAEPVLVIEGAITNMPGPYTIKLSYSAGIYVEDQQAVENATVMIMEESGEEETLTEVTPGTYLTSENGIQGAPNKSYKLSVRLADGSQYESNYQTMPTGISLDTVEVDLEYQYLSIEQPNVPGYQFSVTTDLAEKSENYLLWSLESTFKYRSDFTIDYLYNNFSAQPYPNPTEFMTCWRTDQIDQIYTFNTSTLTNPKVERLPINFERADRPELFIRYSLLVKQFTVNKEAYTFWNKIEGQIENQESLYNNQPFQIRGNIFNVDDSEELVLGYFMAAAQDNKRIFVDPPPGLNLQRELCFADYMGYAFIGLLPQSAWPIYVYEDNGGRAIASKECFDCRERGGTIIEPDFWEE